MKKPGAEFWVEGELRGTRYQGIVTVLSKTLAAALVRKSCSLKLLDSSCLQSWQQIQCDEQETSVSRKLLPGSQAQKLPKNDGS